VEGETLQACRFIYNYVGIPIPKGMYTEHERRQALLKSLPCSACVRDIVELYGVGKTWLYEAIKESAKVSGFENSLAMRKCYSSLPSNDPVRMKIEEHVNRAEFQQYGPKPYLDQIEKDMVAAEADMRDQMGYGYDLKGMEVGLCVNTICIIIHISY
jgi:hypothetical protein